MKSLLLIFAAVTLVIIPLRPIAGQALLGGSGGVDLMYPEFAHPEQDVAAAIRRRDFRFIAVNRARTIVPGMEHDRGLRKIYGTTVIRQRLRLFPSASQNFSYDLRARAYAEQYNRALEEHLLAQLRKKRPNKKRKGASVSGSALHFDGDKPNSVG